jgi:hypothetical protein
MMLANGGKYVQQHMIFSMAPANAPPFTLWLHLLFALFIIGLTVILWKGAFRRIYFAVVAWIMMFAVYTGGCWMDDGRFVMPAAPLVSIAIGVGWSLLLAWPLSLITARRGIQNVCGIAMVGLAAILCLSMDCCIRIGASLARYKVASIFELMTPHQSLMSFSDFLALVRSECEARANCCAFRDGLSAANSSEHAFYRPARFG